MHPIPASLTILSAQMTVALNVKNGKITGLKPACRDCKAMRLLGKKLDEDTLYRAVEKADKAGRALPKTYVPGAKQAVVERAVPLVYRMIAASGQ